MIEPTTKRMTRTLSFGIIALAAWVLLVFFWPNHYVPSKALNTFDLERKLNDSFLETSSNKNNPPFDIRTNLFKPATPLRDKPVADKTIEKIKSKLKLQCIMEINHEPTAYIQIDGAGLKQCRSGQTIHDLFTVLAIHQDRVDVSIIDHKVTLRM